MPLDKVCKQLLDGGRFPNIRGMFLGIHAQRFQFVENLLSLGAMIKIDDGDIRPLRGKFQ